METIGDEVTLKMQTEGKQDDFKCRQQRQYDLKCRQHETRRLKMETVGDKTS